MGSSPPWGPPCWFGLAFDLAVPVWQQALIGAVASVAAQVGDLFESALKRTANVKDSGSIMPGHGGILDRMDSILFALPAVFYMLLAVGVAAMRRIVILGSTGSIGRQTLDIVRAFPDEFEVVGLSAGNNTELLKQQVEEFSPRHVWSAGRRPPANFPARPSRPWSRWSP